MQTNDCDYCVGPETPATTAAPESSEPTKQCSICKTTFPSRSALFKHLRSGACDARLAQAPTKANAILQIGYHSCRGRRRGRAAPRRRRGGRGQGPDRRLVDDAGAPRPGARASAWGDICACCLPPCEDDDKWVDAANARAGGAVEILRRAPLLQNFKADACSSQRVEVLVPSKYVGDLKAFRDAATALLIEARRPQRRAVVAHAFCDDDLPSTASALLPDDQASSCTVKKVHVKTHDDKWVVVALEADRFLRGMARLSLSVRHAGVIVDVALGDEAAFVRPWASDVLEALGPSIDPRCEGLACCKFARSRLPT